MGVMEMAQAELEFAEKCIKVFVSDYRTVMQQQKETNRFGVPGVPAYSSDLFRSVIFSRHLGESVDQTNARIREEIPMLKEVFSAELEDREAAFRRKSKYDKGACVDLSLIEILLLYIAVAPMQDVETLLRETDYGPYRGHPKVNNIAGVFMRSLRAYLRADNAALRAELDSVPKARIDQLLPFFLRMPRKHWGGLLPALFVGNSGEFEKTFKSAYKWYENACKREIKNMNEQEQWMQDQKREEWSKARLQESREICEADRLKRMIETSINPLFLAIVKVARVYRHYDSQWNDTFCPADLISFE